MIKFDKWELEKIDEIQFRLTKEGKFIGYYGYLDQALSKIVNSEALEAIGDQSNIIDALELKDAIEGLYDRLYDVFHYKPKDEPNKER